MRQKRLRLPQQLVPPREHLMLIAMLQLQELQVPPLLQEQQILPHQEMRRPQILREAHRQILTPIRHVVQRQERQQRPQRRVAQTAALQQPVLATQAAARQPVRATQTVPLVQQPFRVE